MRMPPVAKKLSLTIGTLVIFLGLPVLWAWYTFAGPGYYAAFNDIKAALEGIPEVEIIQLGGNEDLTYEDIWAKIAVKGKGRIDLYALSRNSFRESSHIILGAIGPYNIIVEGEGYVGAQKMATGEPVRSQFYGGAVDIGEEGAFAQFFPFKISNFQDVVTRYDDISAIIAEWPVEPDRNHFKDDDGTDYYYYLKMIEPEDGQIASESGGDSAPLSK